MRCSADVHTRVCICSLEAVWVYVRLPVCVCAHVWQWDRLNAAVSEVIPMSGHPQRMWASCKQTPASPSPLHLDINSWVQRLLSYLSGECKILKDTTKRIMLLIREQSFREDATLRTEHQTFHTLRNLVYLVKSWACFGTKHATGPMILKLQ